MLCVVFENPESASVILMSGLVTQFVRCVSSFFCHFVPREDVAVCLAGDGRQWIPSGWVQVLRGPRPKSEKWPVASSGRKQPTSKQQEPIRGRWRQPAPRSNVRAPDPDAALEHVRSKVSSLEGALTAMGSHQGPRSRCPRQCSQKRNRRPKIGH